MSWTKRQFIESAYEEMGYASYIFDLEPEQLERALWRLDSMMATWNAQGIKIGYPLPASPQDSDLDTLTNVPDSANMAIYTALSAILAPTVGKALSQSTAAAAHAGYRVLLQKAAMPREMQVPDTLPLGAGNKTWRVDRDPFATPPHDGLASGAGDDLDFN